MNQESSPQSDLGANMSPVWKKSKGMVNLDAVTLIQDNDSVHGSFINLLKIYCYTPWLERQQDYIPCLQGPGSQSNGSDRRKRND